MGKLINPIPAKFEDELLSHYCVIPFDIIADRKMSAKAKLLYGILTSVAGSSGIVEYDDATKKRFGKYLNCSPTVISRSLTELIDKCYVGITDNKIHLAGETAQ